MKNLRSVLDQITVVSGALKNFPAAVRHFNSRSSELGKGTAHTLLIAVSTHFTRLTVRENQFMGFLSEGLLYKEIAVALGVSYSAVHKHQHNIFEKLHLSNRSEAIRAWNSSKGA